MSQYRPCEDCGHSYRCPSGMNRCLEIAPCSGVPNSTVCACCNPTHGDEPYELPCGCYRRYHAEGDAVGVEEVKCITHRP